MHPKIRSLINPVSKCENRDVIAIEKLELKLYLGLCNPQKIIR